MTHHRPSIFRLMAFTLCVSLLTNRITDDHTSNQVLASATQTMLNPQLNRCVGHNVVTCHEWHKKPLPTADKRSRHVIATRRPDVSNAFSYVNHPRSQQTTHLVRNDPSKQVTTYVTSQCSKQARMIKRPMFNTTQFPQRKGWPLALPCSVYSWPQPNHPVSKMEQRQI